MRFPVQVLAFALLLLIISGCDGNEGAGETVEPTVQVVTTIYPLADIVSELGGEEVMVSHLLPAGASPHTYEPTVEQARLLDQADLLVHVGAGLDDWAIKLAEASGSGPVILDLSRHVDLIASAGYKSLGDPADENHGHSDCDHDHDGHNDCDHHDCDHDHGPADPHFWLDPLIVRDSICPAIHSQLILIAPGSEDYFDLRLSEYREDITVLHEEIEAAVSEFNRQSFISFHSAWQYFAKRYGLEEAAVVARFPGQEPSAGWLAELVELIRHGNMGAIFAEPQFPSDLAERIAEESGTVVKTVDPLGGEGVPGRESYLAMMRFNLAAFQEGLK